MANVDLNSIDLLSEVGRMHLARALAANEKERRDEGITKTSELLAAIHNPTELDYMKLWKALFYCFWMSDKMLIQQQLAEHMSHMLHQLKRTSDFKIFLSCFFQTMQREWMGLDRFRLDKFMSLIRKFVRQAFVFAAHRSFDQEVIEALDYVFGDVVFSSQPNGVRYHLADVLLDELVAAAPDISQDNFDGVMNSCFRVLGGHGSDKVLFERITNCVFHPLMVILKSNAKAVLDSQQAQKAEQQKHMTMEQIDELAGATLAGAAAAVRAAGQVPLTFLNPKQIGEHVFEIAADPKTQMRNRKTLYSMSTSFTQLSTKYQAQFASLCKDTRCTVSKKSSKPASAVQQTSVVKDQKRASDQSAPVSGKKKRGTKRSKQPNNVDAVEEDVKMATPTGSATKKQKKRHSAPSTPVMEHTVNDTNESPAQEAAAVNVKDAGVTPGKVLKSKSRKSPASGKEPKVSSASGTPEVSQKSRTKKSQGTPVARQLVDGFQDIARASIASAEAAFENSDDMDDALHTPTRTSGKTNKLKSTAPLEISENVQRVLDAQASGTPLTKSDKKLLKKFRKAEQQHQQTQIEAEKALRDKNGSAGRRVRFGNNKSLGFHASVKALKQPIIPYSKRSETPGEKPGVLRNVDEVNAKVPKTKVTLKDLEKMAARDAMKSGAKKKVKRRKANGHKL